MPFATFVFCLKILACLVRYFALQRESLVRIQDKLTTLNDVVEADMKVVLELQ